MARVRGASHLPTGTATVASVEAGGDEHGPELGSRFWRSGKLSRMPDRHDPDGLALDAVEEAMGWHDDFAVGQQRELGQSAPRVGEARQSLENSLSP